MARNAWFNCGATLGTLVDQCQAKKKWNAATIELLVATSLHDPNPRLVNLSETLGFPKKGPPEVIDDTTRHFLLGDECNRNDKEFRKNMLAPLFVFSCRQAGFSVAMKGWERTRNCQRFHCQRSKFHKPNKKKRNNP